MSYYDNSKNVSEYIEMCAGYDGTKLYSILQKHLKQKSNLLELGTGPGIDLEVLKKLYDVTASDLSDEFIQRLKEKFVETPVLKIDITDIKLKTKYDCIYSNKVLHHIDQKQLIESLKQQKECLNKDGIIAHSFWIGEKSMEMHGMLFTYYQEKVITDLISQNFEILETYSYSEFEENDSLFIIAKQK